MDNFPRLFLIFICVIIGTTVNAQIPEPEAPGTYLESTYTLDGNDMPFRIMFPVNYQSGQQYPLVLFLHGAGERGNNNESQLVHGSKLFQDSSQAYPAVVVFPQCPRADFWSSVDVEEVNGARRFSFRAEGDPTTSMSLVMSLFEDLLEQPYIDADRVYVTGLSMGGMGTWELLWRMPERIAAAAPICGGGNPQTAAKMTDVPIWAFHGAKDDVVTPRFSVRMVQAVQKAGGNAKVTIFPNANHNSWDPTFADPEYLSWMFSKKISTNNK